MPPLNGHSNSLDSFNAVSRLWPPKHQVLHDYPGAIFGKYIAKNWKRHK